MRRMIREYQAFRDLIFDEGVTFRVSEVFPRLAAVRDALSSADRNDDRSWRSLLDLTRQLEIATSLDGEALIEEATRNLTRVRDN